MGAIKNVDAGASTFFGSGLAMLAVCGTGSAECQCNLASLEISRTYVGQKACAGDIELEQTIGKLDAISDQLEQVPCSCLHRTRRIYTALSI